MTQKHIAISRQYAVVINGPDDIKVYSRCDDDGTQMRRIADELGMAYSPDCSTEQLAEMLLDEFALANGKMLEHGDFAIAKLGDGSCSLYSLSENPRNALLDYASHVDVGDCSEQSDYLVANLIVDKIGLGKRMASIFSFATEEGREACFERKLGAEVVIRQFEEDVMGRHNPAILIDADNRCTRERIEAMCLSGGDVMCIDIAACEDNEADRILRSIVCRFGSSDIDPDFCGVFFNNCARVPEVEGREKVEELIRTALTGGKMAVKMPTFDTEIDFSKIAVAARSRKFPPYLDEGICKTYTICNYSQLPK